MAQLPAFAAELYAGLSGLLSHKLRSLFAMLGMVCGVGAAVATLAINAGAKREMASYVNLLGVHNIIVEAREATDRGELQGRRVLSRGLTLRDYREIAENVPGLEAITPRKRFKPALLSPKPAQSVPLLIGVDPNFASINNLRLSEGRFFDAKDSELSAPVCVLGETAKLNLFGVEKAEGKFLKLGDVWLQVIGVLAVQPSAEAGVENLEITDRNNLIIAPLNTVMRRFEDEGSYLRDEIDGMYMRVQSPADSIATAKVVNAILMASHGNVADFHVVAPAGLLQQRQRTVLSFDLVMTAIAGIALVMGGIGIGSVMLAAVLERTREIGIRRALGARRNNIFRQFLTEAVVMAVSAGVLGVLFGLILTRLISAAAGWASEITFSSVIAAFALSITIGVFFGLYPANHAAKVNPVEAMRG